MIVWTIKQPYVLRMLGGQRIFESDHPLFSQILICVSDEQRFITYWQVLRRENWAVHTKLAEFFIRLVLPKIVTVPEFHLVAVAGLKLPCSDTMFRQIERALSCSYICGIYICTEYQQRSIQLNTYHPVSVWRDIDTSLVVSCRSDYTHDANHYVQIKHRLLKYHLVSWVAEQVCKHKTEVF